MALIPIGDWIDRFGTTDEADEAGEATARTAVDAGAPCARASAAPGRISSAGSAVGAFLRSAWARRNLPRLTLRRG